VLVWVRVWASDDRLRRGGDTLMSVHREGRGQGHKVEFLDDIPTISLEWWTCNFPGFLRTAKPDVKLCLGDAYDERMSGFSEGKR